MMENKIFPLTKAERVRCRPAVIFGAVGSEGALAAIRMLIDIFVTEAALGYCKNLHVMVHPDDSYTIYSADRGFVFDEEIVDGEPAYQSLFCTLYAHPIDQPAPICHSRLYGAPEEERPEQPRSDHSFDFCCVQYASAFLAVRSVRDGRERGLLFEKGEQVSGVLNRASDEPQGTRVHFQPDSEVFGDIAVPYEQLAELLRAAAITIPGLTCRLTIEGGREETFFFEEGICSLAMADHPATPLLFKELAAEGKDRYNQETYRCRLRMVLAFVENGARVACFHNHRAIRGGEHMETLKRHIATRLGLGLDGNTDFDRYAPHLLLLVQTDCNGRDYHRWMGERQRLDRQMVNDMAADLIDTETSIYLEKHKKYLAGFLG